MAQTYRENEPQGDYTHHKALERIELRKLSQSKIKDLIRDPRVHMSADKQTEVDKIVIQTIDSIRETVSNSTFPEVMVSADFAIDRIFQIVGASIPIPHELVSKVKEKLGNRIVNFQNRDSVERFIYEVITAFYTQEELLARAKITNGSLNPHQPDKGAMEALLVGFQEKIQNAKIREKFDVYLLRELFAEKVGEVLDIFGSEDQLQRFTQFLYGSRDAVQAELKKIGDLPETPNEEKLKNAKNFLKYDGYGLLALLVGDAILHTFPQGFAPVWPYTREISDVQDCMIKFNLIAGLVMIGVLVYALNQRKQVQSNTRPAREKLIKKAKEPENAKFLLTTTVEAFQLNEEIQALYKEGVSEDDSRLVLAKEKLLVCMELSEALASGRQVVIDKSSLLRKRVEVVDAEFEEEEEPAGKQTMETRL